MTTGEIIAGVACIGLLLNFIGQIQARIKTKNLETNHMATMGKDIEFLKEENKVQWKKIDEFKDEIRTELREIRDKVIRLDEKIDLGNTLERLIHKALNNGK